MSEIKVLTAENFRCSAVGQYVFSGIRFDVTARFDWKTVNRDYQVTWVDSAPDGSAKAGDVVCYRIGELKAIFGVISTGTRTKTETIKAGHSDKSDDKGKSTTVLVRSSFAKEHKKAEAMVLNALSMLACSDAKKAAVYSAFCSAELESEKALTAMMREAQRKEAEAKQAEKARKEAEAKERKEAEAKQAEAMRELIAKADEMNISPEALLAMLAKM